MCPCLLCTCVSARVRDVLSVWLKKQNDPYSSHTFLKRNIQCFSLTLYSTQPANLHGVPGVPIEASCSCLSTPALRSLPLLRPAPSRHPSSPQATFPNCWDAKNTRTTPLHHREKQPASATHIFACVVKGHPVARCGISCLDDPVQTRDIDRMRVSTMQTNASFCAEPCHPPLLERDEVHCLWTRATALIWCELTTDNTRHDIHSSKRLSGTQCGHRN